MLIRTLSTTFLKIFCKIILNSKVIVKSIFNPDNKFWRKSRWVKSALNGCNLNIKLAYITPVYSSTTILENVICHESIRH